MLEMVKTKKLIYLPSGHIILQSKIASANTVKWQFSKSNVKFCGRMSNTVHMP